jgi:hypothetical protein
VFFLVVRLYLRDWNVSFLLSIPCTRRNSHKTKRDFFPTDNPYIYIFFLSLQWMALEYSIIWIVFFPLIQTQTPYLVITLRLPAILSKEYSVKKRNICIQGLPETASYLLPHVSRWWRIPRFHTHTHTLVFFSCSMICCCSMGACLSLCASLHRSLGGAVIDIV